MYDPLKVEKTDHPDLVGGIVWADCELDWIRDYGKRCFNHGNAKGMESGNLLFEEPKVGAGRTATVTREMIGAAHDVMLAKGDFVLSANLLERIYLAMDQAAPPPQTPFDNLPDVRGAGPHGDDGSDGCGMKTRHCDECKHFNDEDVPGARVAQ